MVTFFQALKHEYTVAGIQSFIIANWVAFIEVYGLYENFMLTLLCQALLVGTLVAVVETLDTPDYIDPPIQDLWICLAADLSVFLSMLVLPRVLLSINPHLFVAEISKPWGLALVMISCSCVIGLLRGASSIVFLLVKYIN